MSDFISLHTHSVFSIRDSIAKIPDLVKKAKEIGYQGLGLTDHGTLAGIPELIKVCNENDIKPILGCELYVATRHRTDKEKGIDKYSHLTVIAMNNQGWKNLMRLVTEAYHPDNFYFKPRVDRELLAKYSEGLIVLSGCRGGHLSKAILNDLHIEIEEEDGDGHVAECTCHDHNAPQINRERYMEVVNWYQKVFGDRFYLEVQRHNFEGEQTVNEIIYEIARKTGLKTIATVDSHFVNPNDVTAHDIMLAIRDNITLNDPKMEKIRYMGDGYDLMSFDDMLKRFPDNKESLTNTMEILERCSVNLNQAASLLPAPVDVREEDEVFRKEVMEGLKRRYKGSIPPEALLRAEEEIRTINQMTFPGYFLIVSDYVRWAKKQGIPVGPGRGSAAGSICAYALDIVDLNPLDYELSFSRFLNKGRCAIPQISFPELPFADWKLKKQQMGI